MEDTLNRCEKDHFLDFRNRKITFDQFKVRVAEASGIAYYKVYDDIKSDLHPSITTGLEKFGPVMEMMYRGVSKDKVKMDDLLKPLEDWQVNMRCLKTLQYKHVI